MGIANSDPLQRWLDDGGSVRAADLHALATEAEEPAGPIEALLANARSLLEAFSDFAAAEVDLARLQVRNLVLRFVLLVAAGIAVILTFVACAVFLILGVAEGLGQALGGRAWLGNFLAGAMGMASIVGALWLLEAKARRVSLNKRIAKYERPGN